jgi:hypothetical protein
LVLAAAALVTAATNAVAAYEAGNGTRSTALTAVALVTNSAARTGFESRIAVRDAALAETAVAAYENNGSGTQEAALTAVALLVDGTTKSDLTDRITAEFNERAAQQAAETAVAAYENNGSGTKSDADTAISALDPGAFKTALENRVTAETAVRAYEAGGAGDKAAADTAISALDLGAVKNALENRVTARFNALVV